METAPQNVALVYAPCTSASNPQILFPISTETSLRSVTSLHYSDTSPEGITATNL
jgi:hypothetical protein